MSDLTNALLTEWAQIPTDTLQNLMERLLRRVEAARAAKGANSILMLTVLERDVQQAHIGVMSVHILLSLQCM